MRAHLPGEGMESWARTRHQPELLRCDLTEETCHCSCRAVAPPCCRTGTSGQSRAWNLGVLSRFCPPMTCARVQGQQLCRSSRDSRSATQQKAALSLESPTEVLRGWPGPCTPFSQGKGTCVPCAAALTQHRLQKQCSFLLLFFLSLFLFLRRK